MSFRKDRIGGEVRATELVHRGGFKWEWHQHQWRYRYECKPG